MAYFLSCVSHGRLYTLSIPKYAFANIKKKKICFIKKINGTKHKFRITLRENCEPRNKHDLDEKTYKHQVSLPVQ